MKVVYITGLLCFSGVVGFAEVNNELYKQTTIESKLKTIQLKETHVPVKRYLEGKIEAVNQATISAQTSGQIADVYFDVNDTVQKGQLLLRMRDLHQQAAYTQALAAQEEAQANLLAAQAKNKRTILLHQEELTSESELDSVNAELFAARARLEAAKAAVTSTLEQISYTSVVAPYSGIVTERHIQVGEVAHHGAPLFSGFSMDELRVVTRIPQEMMTQVKRFQKAEVLLPKGDAVEAKKITIFPYADARSSTFTTRVELPSNLEGLFPGMFVKVSFVVGNEHSILIPETAVAYRSGVSTVYTRDKQGKISQRLVRLGRKFQGGNVVVLAGLALGDEVVTNPLNATVMLKMQRQSN